MGGHFLQLRDQGCQGAWKIFTRAREVCQSAPPADKAEDSLSVALSIASGREDAMETWGKSIALAGCVQTDNLLQADIIVGEGIPQEELLRMSGRGNSPTIINGGNETASPCRVLGDLLALTRNTGMTPTGLTEYASAGSAMPQESLRVWQTPGLNPASASGMNFL